MSFLQLLVTVGGSGAVASAIAASGLASLLRHNPHWALPVQRLSLALSLLPYAAHLIYTWDYIGRSATDPRSPATAFPPPVLVAFVAVSLFLFVGLLSLALGLSSVRPELAGLLPLAAGFGYWHIALRRVYAPASDLPMWDNIPLVKFSEHERRQLEAYIRVRKAEGSVAEWALSLMKAA